MKETNWTAAQVRRCAHITYTAGEDVFVARCQRLASIAAREEPTLGFFECIQYVPPVLPVLDGWAVLLASSHAHLPTYRHRQIYTWYKSASICNMQRAESKRHGPSQKRKGNLNKTWTRGEKRERNEKNDGQVEKRTRLRYTRRNQKRKRKGGLKQKQQQQQQHSEVYRSEGQYIIEEKDRIKE